MFEWMAWTLPVAVFFSCIALMLVVLLAPRTMPPPVTRPYTIAPSRATAATPKKYLEPQVNISSYFVM